jgi:hypothetical protein
MLRLLLLVAACALTAAPVDADEYWVSYQGDDYPENEGWRRVFTDENGMKGQGGAIRSLEDGALVLDSLRSVLIVDFYEMSRPIDPDPGELFVMRWRLKVDSVPQHYDPAVALFSDTSSGVAFHFTETALISALEPNVTVPFEPQLFHLFELTSSDMQRYELSIDGSPAINGRFMPAGPPSRIAWGDGVQGATSVSRWDYFEFGVVPEPPSMSCMLFVLVVASANGRKPNCSRSLE